MVSSQKVAISTLWQIASQVAMAALSIATVKCVALGLSKELAGNYNSAYGYLQLFGILADFGLYAVAVREMSRAKNREDMFGSLIILRIIILVLSLSIALMFVWFVPIWKGTALPKSVTIAALVPFFTLLAGILRTIFQVEYKMAYVFIAEVTQRIVTVLLIGFLIFLGIRGSNDLYHLYLFLFFGGFGAFVLFALSFFFANRITTIRLRWNRILLIHLIQTSAPFGLAYLCIAFYRQFDLTLIALLRPDFELQNAYYGFVIRIMDMAFLIPTFLLNSVLPLICSSSTNKKKVNALLEKTLLVILILGSISALYALLWSRPLMQLLTTDSYLATNTQAGSDTALRLLAFPIFLNGIVLYGFYTILTQNQWKPLVSTLGLGVLISFLFNAQLIPQFGFVGAAITSNITHFFLAVILILKSFSILPIRLPVQSIVRWIIFSGLLFCFLFFVRPFLINEIYTLLWLSLSVAILWILLTATGMIKTMTNQ